MRNEIEIRSNLEESELTTWIFLYIKYADITVKFI